MKRRVDVVSAKFWVPATARTKLAKIIDDVEDGQDVEIVRRGKKVAVLVSSERYARLLSEKKEFGEAYDAFMKNRDPKTFGLEPEEIAGLRDRAPGRVVAL